jgi:hypothetical protein
MNRFEENQVIILNKLRDIERQLSEKKHKMNEYISEADAKKMFDKKTTWFWERRRAGELPYTKVGSQVYYKRKDLIQYLEKGYTKH